MCSARASPARTAHDFHALLRQLRDRLLPLVGLPVLARALRTVCPDLLERANRSRQESLPGPTAAGHVTQERPASKVSSGTLIHAFFCTDAQCQSPDCADGKRVVQRLKAHVLRCRLSASSTGSCQICKLYQVIKCRSPTASVDRARVVGQIRDDAERAIECLETADKNAATASRLLEEADVHRAVARTTRSAAATADEVHRTSREADVALRDALETPASLCCPISCALLDTPVISHCHHVFEKGSIELWLGGRLRACPICRDPLSADFLQPAPQISAIVRQWKGAVDARGRRATLRGKKKSVAPVRKSIVKRK